MHTLSANTNVSALTLANGDTIDVNGFRLTLNVVPSVTGISVISPGTAGTVVFGLTTSYPLTGWTMTAGTGVLIASIASGVTVGASLVAGTTTNANCVQTNNGTITGSVSGGSGSSANGIGTNNGTVSGVVTGGSGPNARGIFTNNGTVTGHVHAGTASGADGVFSNLGTISGPVSGGSIAGAHGVATNSATITGDATGGSIALSHGVATNNGMLLGDLNDATGRAVNGWSGSAGFVIGPGVAAIIPSNIKTIYSFGELNPLATIAGDATVITLSEGSGGHPFKVARKMRGGSRI